MLGVTILNIDSGYTFVQSLVNALGAGLGFLLAMVMFAGVRERLESAEIPEGLKGLADHAGVCFAGIGVLPRLSGSVRPVKDIKQKGKGLQDESHYVGEF